MCVCVCVILMLINQTNYRCYIYNICNLFLFFLT